MTITTIRNQDHKTFAIGEQVVVTSNGRRATVVSEPIFTYGEVTGTVSITQTIRFSVDDSVCPNGEWGWNTWGLASA